MAIDSGRAKALFQAAIEITDRREREAFLDREAIGDKELRDRLDALIAAYDGPPLFLDGPLDPTGDAPASATDPARDDEPVAIRRPDPAPTPLDTVIAGRYKIRQEIGEGGMGSVYLAEQTQPVRRMVALKLIKPGMDSRSVLARFESERQALALMDHPNIAKVLDAGTTDAGRPFFVMELVKGIPLTDYCDRHQLGIPDRLGLFRQICSAVQHAHQKGIIHRDLKPTNILVESHDGKPVPKVIDFGLAKATSGMRLSEHSLFTAFGSVTGTPLYMAPEQAMFNALDVDTRADIYALGVILYELLTGSTPIRRDTLKQAALDEMLRVIREEEPPTPSSRIGSSETLPSLAAARHVEPARLSRLVRRDLDWIVMKALAKERDRRYDSAIGLGNDVERYLNHEPVSAGPPTAAYRLRKFIRRNRGRVAAASFVLLALVAGVVGTTWGFVEARRHERKAVAESAEKEKARAAEAEQRQRAEKRLGQVAKMNDILGSIFGDLDPRKVDKEGKPLSAVLGERLDRATAEIEGDATGDPLAVARMQMILGGSQLGLGYAPRAIELLSRARATFASALGPDHPDTLKSMHILANSYDAAGRQDEALKLREQVLALQKEKLALDDPRLLGSMSNLANSYNEAGRWDEALKLREQVLALQKGKLGPDHPDTPGSMHNLANSYHDAGRRDEALKLFEQVLALQKKALGPDHPDVLMAMGNLASDVFEAGRRDEALKLREQVLALQKGKLGSGHPDTLKSMMQLARSYQDSGQSSRALSLSEEAATLCGAKLGPHHPQTLYLKRFLAYLYSEMGQHDRAIRIHEEVLALSRAKLGPDHPDTLRSLVSLGMTCLNAGQHDRALKIYEETLAPHRAKLGPDHPETLAIMKNLAQSYQNLGRYDREEPLWDALVEAYRRTQGEDHATTLAARLDRADLDQVRGRLEAAEKAYSAILEVCRPRLGPDHDDTDWAENGLAQILVARGYHSRAVPHLRAAVARGRKARSDRPALGERLTYLGNSLLATRLWGEAEAVLREALEIREEAMPGDWKLSNTRSKLGAALLGQKKYAEAAPFLREGYGGLKARAGAIQASVRSERLREALDSLIALGEATGKADEVKAWKAERAKLDAPKEATKPEADER